MNIERDMSRVTLNSQVVAQILNRRPGKS